MVIVFRGEAASKSSLLSGSASHWAEKLLESMRSRAQNRRGRLENELKSLGKAMKCMDSINFSSNFHRISIHFD